MHDASFSARARREGGGRAPHRGGRARRKAEEEEEEEEEEDAASLPKPDARTRRQKPSAPERKEKLRPSGAQALS
ncbi:unnamed protein product [Prorocentrum cordatum]|uniref:Uncharacterized protein n=1 Tax=Prorocentrum cordatum TaxID=2364126 RepID=A0ABN9V147_9DINO|nr:unnamed protein product [Polarella glacialis]